MLKATAKWALLGVLMVATPIHAQSDIDLHQAVGAAILSDASRDRQAEREARRQPYISPVYGNITTANGARNACIAKAREQAGPGAKLIGQPIASTMSTGWEVEGTIAPSGGESIPFVCSVRNGSVSAILLQR
ncbi:MAG: hypothetical protein I8H96_08160 [Sphingomonadaceae bacterium]|nr:hypothetical protein [Sphingomonadaceae bacterium]